MRAISALLLCLALSTTCFSADSNKGYFVTYAGGSVANLKSKSYLRLFLDGNEIRLRYKKEAPLVIPISAITGLSYSRDSRRRIVEGAALGVFTLGIGSVLAFSKSNKHYIGLTWDDPSSGSKGGLAVQVQNGDYRGVILGLEAMTGKKVVDLDAAASQVPGSSSERSESSVEAPKP
jgi:hypothetical protein